MRTGLACGGRERPANVHVHSGSRAGFLRKSLALWLARRGGAKTIFHLHSGGVAAAQLEAGPLPRRWVRRAPDAGSRVITLSPGWTTLERECAPRARAQVEVLPNPVRRPPQPVAGRAEPGRILFLGRIDSRDGRRRVEGLLVPPRDAPFWRWPSGACWTTAGCVRGWRARRAQQLNDTGRAAWCATGGPPCYTQMLDERAQRYRRHT